MRHFFGLCLLVFVGVVGWKIGGTLSTDAIGMAVGICFGIMAAIPTTLIILASERRREQGGVRPEGNYRQARRDSEQLKIAALGQPQIVNHFHYHAAQEGQTVSRMNLHRDRLEDIQRRHGV